MIVMAMGWPDGGIPVVFGHLAEDLYFKAGEGLNEPMVHCPTGQTLDVSSKRVMTGGAMISWKAGISPSCINAVLKRRTMALFCSWREGVDLIDEMPSDEAGPATDDAPGGVMVSRISA